MLAVGSATVHPGWSSGDLGNQAIGAPKWIDDKTGHVFLPIVVK
jgi:hypothetical protein